MRKDADILCAAENALNSRGSRRRFTGASVYLKRLECETNPPKIQRIPNISGKYSAHYISGEMPQWKGFFVSLRDQTPSRIEPVLGMPGLQ